jgi:hypothetical protein
VRFWRRKDAEDEYEGHDVFCAICGVLLDDRYPLSLNLEIYRHPGDFGDFDFCTQEHAAVFFSKPIVGLTEHPADDDKGSGFTPLEEVQMFLGYFLLPVIGAWLALFGAWRLGYWAFTGDF